jgi:hypothetical protein
MLLDWKRRATPISGSTPWISTGYAQLAQLLNDSVHLTTTTYDFSRLRSFLDTVRRVFEQRYCALECDIVLQCRHLLM